MADGQMLWGERAGALESWDGFCATLVSGVWEDAGDGTLATDLTGMILIFSADAGANAGRDARRDAVQPVPWLLEPRAAAPGMSNRESDHDVAV